MLHPVIDWTSCQVCYPCPVRLVCKPRALMQIDPDDPPYIDYSRCTACGQCVQACPSAAIAMQNSKIPNMHRVIR